MLEKKKAEFEERGGFFRILEHLGLAESLLREALTFALGKYEGRSDGLPPSYEGAAPSAETKAHLARALGAAGSEVTDQASVAWTDGGWTIKTKAGNGAEAFTLRVWLGDSLTGHPDPQATPRPRARKGESTRLGVARNNGEQLRLVRVEDGSELADFAVQDERLLVILLFRFEFAKDATRIHYELSIPNKYDEDSRTVEDWAVRHPFPPFLVSRIPPTDPFDDEPEIDPPLRRR
ncbi:MAG: hypothetical protein H6712_24235 [Myxococcales bacterium]|nr:hypothetical protein [Myxococcales bacterium]